ncbi:hypothetical protein E1286_31115 [Nonomuraea terrae]|uniref:Uncharacterized protein n=1 Tax=Nonomuraea terrae TaxID=2530383 RepID=A0A4R4YCD4_9ACTN|nr:hypothetical protein [Nonomuraea terrae]TDD42265.1 hypothetical protein E1286_31115 [Nonomuraea terrae]
MAAPLVLVMSAVVVSTPSPEGASAAVAHAGHDWVRDRGNSWKSGNYRVRGRQVNSGNWDNANGAVNSDNSINGGNFANGPQHIVEGKGIARLDRR